MSGIGNGHVLLALGPRNATLKNQFAAFRYRIRIAERGQKRLRELFQNKPRGFVLRHRAVLQSNRDQRRKAARTRLECFIRKWRVVRRYLRLAQSAAASQAHNLPDRQNRYALAEFQPLLERRAESLA